MQTAGAAQAVVASWKAHNDIALTELRRDLINAT